MNQKNKLNVFTLIQITKLFNSTNFILVIQIPKKLLYRLFYQQNLYNSYLFQHTTNLKKTNNSMQTSINNFCDNGNSGSKKKNCKMEVSYKKLTMGLQTYKDIKEAHLKNRVCDQSLDYNQNKQCTFQPRLSSKKSTNTKQQRRSLKKFLEDQQTFTTTKKKKIEQLRLEISKQQQDEIKAKPMIDSVSHRISTQMSQKNNQSVFERLSKEKTIIHDVFEQEDMFSPKICVKSKTMRREKDVASLLYEDAQRRRQKEEMNFQELVKKEFTPQINSNTNDLVIRKIYNEFVSKIKQETISPLLAITVLSQIFNVDLNPNKSPEQEELCEKVLFFIADTRTETVNAEVLWNFIQTIVNGHLMNSNFTEEQEDKILEHFGHFYTSRMTKTRKSLTPQRYSFKPKTLRSSQKLAYKHRQRTLSSINDYLQSQKVNIDIKNNSIKIEDLFIIEHLKKNSEIQRKKIEKENLEVQQCSFRPNLELSTQTQKIAHKRVNLIVPRTTKTQQLQKKVKIKKKQEQIQNKQNQQRLKTINEGSNSGISKTLHSTTNRNGEARTPKAEVKNIEKSVMRVALARKNRQLVNALNERGYPSNVENWQSFRKSMKRDLEKSSQKILKGYKSLEKLNCSFLKTSTLLTSKQINF